MTSDGAIRQTAPAKINLTLHVTGQRSDGYHLLDSLVTFAEVGDVVTARPSDRLSLTIDGPFAKGLSATDNLVLDAARLYEGRGAALTLTKNLPVASGIGGGSADAAATLHALSQLHNLPLPDPAAQLTLGADVPACVQGGLLRMRGVGEEIEVLADHPLRTPMVVVNPNVPLSTPQVFARLPRKTNEPMPERLTDWSGNGLLDWLSRQRNDLEAPAIELAPVIGDVLKALRDTGGFARMSGSGATCFALYSDERNAVRAVEEIAAAHPDWWTVLAIT